MTNGRMRGRPAFAVIGVKDSLALEALALGRNKGFMSYLDEISSAARRGRSYSMEEMRREFQIPARDRRRSAVRR